VGQSVSTTTSDEGMSTTCPDARVRLTVRRLCISWVATVSPCFPLTC